MAVVEKETKKKALRERPVKWPEDGSGYLLVLSSDNETWYTITMSGDGNLACECIGYNSRGYCYHCQNGALALEVKLEAVTKGQIAFEQATRSDFRRMNIRDELTDWTEGIDE